MHIMFYKQGETKPYRSPNDVALDDGETIDFNETDIVHVDPPEPDAKYITAYTEGGYFYITFDENDLDKLNGAMHHTYMARKAMHAELDKMLDAVDANGFSQEDLFLKVQAYDVETTPANVVVENLMEFVTEFVSGEVEERTVESKTFKDQVPTTTWKQTIE